MDRRYSNPLSYLGRVHTATPCDHCAWACMYCAKEPGLKQVQAWQKHEGLCGQDLERKSEKTSLESAAKSIMWLYNY